MRIAIVTETFLPKWDGIANTLCHLLDYTEERGHTTQLFAPQGVVPCYGKTRVVHFPSIPFPLYPSLRLAPPLSDMRESLLEFEPDVMHVVGPISLGIEALRRARELHIPAVASFHTDVAGFAEQWGLGLFSNFVWQHLRELHNQAQLNLAPSHFTKRQLARLGFKRVGVWSRGVNTGLFAPERRSQEMRARLSQGEPDKPLLLYVGRLSPEKRVDLLKGALQANPHCHLAIVGDGPQRGWLENHFAGTPTHFTGQLRDEELAGAYASADIFTYTGAHETFGNVVLEAMASGLAVAAPAGGGLLDFAKHGRNALLFRPGDSQDLSKVITQLRSDPQLAGRLAAAGRETARSRTWQRALDGLAEHYFSLLTHYQPQASALQLEDSYPG
ncbi:MAG: glycosyltransferase family 1 protein [Anaerolineales bacterium]|nr:glycosyltransferase family 1 protein [Anaerolineales bacterium]